MMTPGTKTLLSAGRATVPPWMIGCWRRDWIRFAGGDSDNETRVIWLQAFSGHADIRIPKRPRPGAMLNACTREDFLALAAQQASCGTTTHVLKSGRVQAKWNRLVGYELESTFPEPGWMDWHPPDCMMEYAPSGAYEEDWRLRKDSEGQIAVLELEHARQRTLLYVAGDHAVRVRDRSNTPGSTAPLSEFVEDPRMQHDALIHLLDCEFSYAVRDRSSNRHIVQLSTLPRLEGTSLDLEALLSVQPENGALVDPAGGGTWRVHEWGTLTREQR